jgi:hypothetical protein
MSANTANRDALVGPNTLPDPGSAGVIRCGERGYTVIGLRSAAAEARTLAAPSRVGQQCVVYMDTDGGDITLTVSSNSSQTSATYTFDDAGDIRVFTAITEARVLKWGLS